jgi:hypothetical protein
MLKRSPRGRRRRDEVGVTGAGKIGAESPAVYCTCNFLEVSHSRNGFGAGNGRMYIDFLGFLSEMEEISLKGKHSVNLHCVKTLRDNLASGLAGPELGTRAVWVLGVKIFHHLGCVVELLSF